MMDSDTFYLCLRQLRQCNVSDVFIHKKSIRFEDIYNKSVECDDLVEIIEQLTLLDIRDVALLLLMPEEAEIHVVNNEWGNFRISKNGSGEQSTIIIRLLPIMAQGFNDIPIPLSVIKLIEENRKGFYLLSGSINSGLTTTLSSILNYITSQNTSHVLSINSIGEYPSIKSSKLINVIHLKSDQVKSLDLILQSGKINIATIENIETHQDLKVLMTLMRNVDQVFCVSHGNYSLRPLMDLYERCAELEEDLRHLISRYLTISLNQCLLPSIDGENICVFEYFIGIPAARNLIRENNTAAFYSLIQTGTTGGYSITRDQVLHQLIEDNIIDREIAFEYAMSKENFLPEDGK
jgi:twitching motility protein PilT